MKYIYNFIFNLKIKNNNNIYEKKIIIILLLLFTIFSTQSWHLQILQILLKELYHLAFQSLYKNDYFKILLHLFICKIFNNYTIKYIYIYI